MHVDELDYALPERLIAQHPAEPRDAARLMVVDRATGDITLDTFRNLPAYLAPGDALVVNDTQVIRARLHGQKPTGGKVEIFLLREVAPGAWAALMKPSAKIPPGMRITLAGGYVATAGGRLPNAQRMVHFATPEVLSLLEEAGEIPLPPYIHRDAPEASDLRDYQTLFAAQPGAVAAPTAGLHYTPAVLEALAAKNIARHTVTLHVGYGTFRPIQHDDIADHVVDTEDFEVSEETAAALNAVRARRGRIVAVGTTATRVLETQCFEGVFRAGAGRTDKYIFPPYRFQGVDLLQTNFHLPRSSLLALVYAFGGRELIRAAYARAIAEDFRFYSYGDTMLIR